MRNVLIIEDEKPAMERLIQMLKEIDPAISISGQAQSVRQAVEWLQMHPAPDLILMDIALSDGSSFDIFEKIDITCPVIFITAYDEYWQEAFEHNSIDYLLKPVKEDKLKNALDRYDKLRTHFHERIPALLDHVQTPPSYRKRFLVKRGHDLFSIPMEEIAYFFASEKIVCMVDTRAQRFVLDHSLADLEKQLDPAIFYRVNRKFILHRDAIQKAKAYSKSKLLLEVQPAAHEEIIISQEQMTKFKEWFGN